MVVWVAGKNCDPVNTCHSVGRKNALYKYLILYFAFYFTTTTGTVPYLSLESSFSTCSNSREPPEFVERHLFTGQISSCSCHPTFRASFSVNGSLICGGKTDP